MAIYSDRQGVANVFQSRYFILTMSVYHLSLHESVAGNRDANSRNEKNTMIINFLESVGMEGTRGYG